MTHDVLRKREHVPMVNYKVYICAVLCDSHIGFNSSSCHGIHLSTDSTMLEEDISGAAIEDQANDEISTIV